MNAAATVSFVIPVRNDAERLRRCLRSIRANSYVASAVEIVVADNGSIDDSVAVALAEGASVLDLPGLRVGQLRNRAAAMTHGDVLAFVDADNEISSGWIAAAAAALAAEHVGAVGAPYLPPSPSTWVQRLYDGLRRHPQGRERVSWLGSGNMAVRRVAFIEVNGFDTTLETCEDVDLCRKLAARGYTILSDSRLENIHYGDPRTLANVFYGELWRGRDNVRVSLRTPRAWRTLVSAAIPAGVLVALLAIVTGLAMRSVVGLELTATASLAIVALIIARATLMVRGSILADLAPAFTVAAAYELGRAFALTTRVTHAKRRAGANA